MRSSNRQIRQKPANCTGKTGKLGEQNRQIAPAKPANSRWQKSSKIKPANSLETFTRANYKRPANSKRQIRVKRGKGIVCKHASPVFDKPALRLVFAGLPAD